MVMPIYVMELLQVSFLYSLSIVNISGLSISYKKTQSFLETINLFFMSPIYNTQKNSFFKYVWWKVIYYLLRGLILFLDDFGNTNFFLTLT